MKFQSLPDVLQSLLLFFIFVTLIINVYCVVFGIVFRSKKKYKIVNGVLLISTGTLFYIVSLAYYDMHRNYIADEMPSFFNKPALPLAVLVFLLFAFSAISLYSFLIWRKNYITPASIKEGMDKLPSGLCYHNDAGVPKFINHRMNNLCRFLTEEALFDANDFWERLTKGRITDGNVIEKRGENPIITLYGGSTISFTKRETEIGGEKMYEIRATDITKQFSLHNELQKSNSNLRILNRRLQEYGENVWDITREREILAAKVNIHDMLGKALLVTKRFIESGDESITKEELSDMWKGTLYLFEGGFKENSEDGSLDELYDAAKIMGISLTVDGQLPKDNQVLRFVMSGARESLTNAVHHARAGELNVKLYNHYGYAVIEYTNDGEKPTQEVSEGGGLSSLRQAVEAAGGIMETDIYPRFVLRLKIPSKEAF